MKRRHTGGTRQGNKWELGSATPYVTESVRINNTVCSYTVSQESITTEEDFNKLPPWNNGALPHNNNYLASQTMKLLEENLQDNGTEWAFFRGEDQKDRKLKQKQTDETT